MTENRPQNLWARSPFVLEALGTILRDPSGDHTELAARVLGGKLTEAQAVAVFSLLHGSSTWVKLFEGSFTSNSALALDLVLYHLSGGAAAGLSAPWVLDGDARLSNAKRVWKRLKSLSDKRENERKRIGMVAARDPSGVYLLKVLDTSILRTEGVAAESAGGGGSEPPPVSAPTSVEDADRLLAFAMGTHERLGRGYASRDAPCGVRLLAGHHDVLRAIANCLHHGHTGAVIKPAPHELYEMRKVCRGLERERLMLRAAIAELQDQLHSRTRACDRGLRREASLKRQIEKLNDDWDAALEQLDREHLAEQRRLQLVLRASEKERNDEAVRWQLKVNAAENAGIAAVRQKVSDQREELRRAAADRDEALAEQIGAEARARELEAALERVRTCSKVKMMEELAEAKEIIARLSERRKANQRTVSDANLAVRRAAEAQKKLEAERSSFRTFLQREEVNNEHVSAARREADELRAKLAAAEAETKVMADLAAKFKAVAEPVKEYFFESGRFTSAVDSAILECLSLGVARNKVPQLFDTFRRFFRVKVPTRTKKVQAPRANGKRQSVERELAYIPGISHCKDMAAVMYELNKLQAGEWLKGYLESDEETSCCYLQDGAESQQIDYLGQILARRIDGELKLCALDLAKLKGKTAEAQAAAFDTSISEIVELMKSAEMADERTVNMLRRFLPTCSMNDRASTARKTARLVLGLDEGDNDPTCAEHALVNILDAGKKAFDKVLRALLNITDEQAAADEAKIKALRTCVGWFSSPACALIYQVAKYVALCSSKGYAIGEKFREWLDARLADAEDQTLEMLGHSEDLLAICGSRMYVFFQDAAVTERLLSAGSLLTYLEEEADLGADAGGKLRKSILTGAKNEPCMAAVRAMAIISDMIFRQVLQAIKPGPEAHAFDVLPKLWPKVVAFMEMAAANPSKIIDGSLRLDTSDVCGPRLPEIDTPKAQRARADMERIYARAAGDDLVKDLLSKAFAAMAEATRSHASDWLGPDGKLCAEKITPELRAKYDALVTTSTSVERLHALGRHTDDRAGQQRPESHAGIALAMFNKQAAWLQSKTPEERQRMMDAARPAARKLRRVSLKQQRIEEGRAKRAERDRLLSSKRAKREAKAAERQRIEQLPLAQKYSELKTMANPDLSDQLKAYKIIHQKTGFTTTQPSRKEYVLQVQRLMFDMFGASAADLPEGDNGFDNKSLRKKRVATAAGTARGKRKRKVEYNGYEWDENEEFIVDCIIGKMVADGGPIPGPVSAKPPPPGTVLYKVLWEGFPPEVATWEPEENLQDPLILEEIDKYEAALSAEAELDAEEARDLASDDPMDE